MNPNVYSVDTLTDAELFDIFDGQTQEGIYICPSNTGQAWFHRAIRKSSALFFIRGGNKNIVAIAIGAQWADNLETQKYLGFLVRTHVEHPKV